MVVRRIHTVGFHSPLDDGYTRTPIRHAAPHRLEGRPEFDRRKLVQRGSERSHAEEIFILISIRISDHALRVLSSLSGEFLEIRLRKKRQAIQRRCHEKQTSFDNHVVILPIHHVWKFKRQVSAMLVRSCEFPKADKPVSLQFFHSLNLPV